MTATVRQVQVPGKSLVRVGLNTVSAGVVTPCADAGGLDLGYTRNQVDISEDTQLLPVPGDENGGDAGDPIEFQVMTKTLHMRCEFTKWNKDGADILRKNGKVQTVVGGVWTVGSLLYANGDSFAISVTSAVDSYFSVQAYNCICQQPVEIGRGTRFSVLVCDIEAHMEPSNFSGTGGVPGRLFTATATI